MDLGHTKDRRPEKLRFPTHWSRGLAKERSRRNLGKWRNFWYGGFGIYGEELANRAGERKPLKLCLWRREEEEDEQEMREPELELRRWTRTSWTSEAAGKRG